jgi:hypothetical protein
MKQQTPSTIDDDCLDDFLVGQEAARRAENCSMMSAWRRFNLACASHLALKGER